MQLAGAMQAELKMLSCMDTHDTNSQLELKLQRSYPQSLLLQRLNRNERISAIAHYLSQCQYDIVCLQECWVYKDFEIIRQAVRQNLPFSRFFHTGAFGSGLAIFTRFPLISGKALPYSLSGTPQQTIAGDFFVNKAAANVVILHPVLGEVEIWNTHMHAAGEAPPDTRQAHRIAQSWQLANEIRRGAGQGRYVLAMGDLNSQPFSIPIGIMRSHAALNDSFLDTHPHANEPPTADLLPEDALATLGMSCDSPLNTWSHGKPIPQHIFAQGGKRLDYIFYRQPAVAKRRPLIWSYRDNDHSRSSLDDEAGLEGGKPIEDSMANAPLLRCVASEVVMTDLVPGQAYSYSDHFGLLSTFSIDSPGSTHAIDNRANTPSTATSVHTAKSSTPLVPHLDSTPKAAPPKAAPPISPRASSSSSTSPKLGIIRSALANLRAYTSIARNNSKFHLRMSAASLVVLIGLTVGSAWQPKSWIQPIFTIVAGLLGAAGATFFYFGFLWGRWEEGLLTEVTEEMELELRIVELEERTSSRGS